MYFLVRCFGSWNRSDGRLYVDLVGKYILSSNRGSNLYVPLLSASWMTDVVACKANYRRVRSRPQSDEAS